MSPCNWPSASFPPNNFYSRSKLSGGTKGRKFDQILNTGIPRQLKKPGDDSRVWRLTEGNRAPDK